MSDIGNDFLGRHKNFRLNHRRLTAVFIILALFVAVFVFWWLKLTGITVTGDALCDLDEHIHTQECFTKVLICTETESESTETQDSSVSEQPSLTEPESSLHNHSEECYTSELICNITEHSHSSQCFPDVQADTETVSDWLKTIESVKITNDIPENLVAIALSQQDYKESQLNFEYDTDGNKHGYTRFGEWYGNPYGKWNTMFISFCLHFSNINNVDELKSAGAEAMRLKWIERLAYSDAETASPKRGDIVFFDENGDGVADTSAIILVANDDGLLIIEGDSDNKVEVKPVDITDKILGYGLTGELGFAKDMSFDEAVTENTAEEAATEAAPPLLMFSTGTHEPNITYINDLTTVIKSVTFKTVEGDIIGSDDIVYLGQSYVISMRFAEKNTGDQWIQFRHDDDHHLHYQIPENLHCEPFDEWHPITAKTENGAIEEVGEYFVNDQGLLIVVFYDDPVTGECFGARYSNVDFTIDFNAKVGTSVTGSSSEVNFNDEIKINLNIDTSAEMKVTKTHGTYNGKDNTIEYQIRIEGKKAVIQDLVVPDDVWEKHYVLKDTIVVTDLNGKILDPQPTIGDGRYANTYGFTLTDFPDFAAGEGFIITYKASINDELLGGDSVGLWNGVYPYGKDSNGNEVKAEADDWVEVELNKIEKEGKQSVITAPDGTIIPVIEWHIEIKKSDSNLEGTVVVDTLGHGLEYYTDQSILIRRYDQWGNRLSDSYLSWDNITVNDNSMSFALPEGHRFEIIYYTSYEELQEGEQKKYTNSAKVTINQREEVAGGVADVVGFIPRVSKSASGNDGEFVYFTIQADVPGVIKDWGSFFLTDLSAFWGYNNNDEGYLYIENTPEDLVITAVTDSGRTINFTPYVPGGPTENTYILVHPAEGNQQHSFNIYFNTSDADADLSTWKLSENSVLTISYKIPFDAKTGVEWTGELTGDKTIEEVLLENYKLANEVYMNYTDVIRVTASTNYEYSPKIIKKSSLNDDGTIDYTVIFQNSIPGSGGNEGYLTSASSVIFTDTFDEKLEYVEGSLMVTCYDPWRDYLWLNKFKYNGAADGNSLNVSGTEFQFYEYNFAEAQYYPDGSTFWGDWLSYRTDYLDYCNLTKGGKHIFTYKLKLKDEYYYSTEENKYELDNTAELFWNGDNSSGPATESVELNTGLLDKSVVQENNELLFDIHVNRHALDILEGIDTLTIEDTMTENLSVYWRSIKLQYEDKTTGTWIDFDSEESIYEYSVIYDQTTNKLTFEIPDSLHVRIDYTTLITKSGLVSVDNVAKVEGKAKIADFIEATFKVEDHSGGATGSMHEIILIKQDGDTDERLPGITFHLYGPVGDSNAVIPDGVASSIVTTQTKTLRYIGTYTTGDDGTVLIKSQYLTPGGPYGLVEAAPPEGYIELNNPVYFYYYEQDPDGIIQTVTTIISVENYIYGFVFPETGGSGILPTAIIGTSLMLFPILYSIIRRKRERRLY